MIPRVYAQLEDLPEYWSEPNELEGLPEKKLQSLIRRASEDVDTLTYGRITDPEALTEFQQEKVRAVTCQLAEFQHLYGDMLDNPLSGYSINGVSASFGSGAIATISGVKIPQRLYGLLYMTGLCSRRLR